MQTNTNTEHSMIAVADALREGRPDVADLAASEAPDVMERVRDLCARLTAAARAAWPACAANWTTYAPDHKQIGRDGRPRRGVKYLRIVEYRAMTIRATDEDHATCPESIDSNGYRFLGMNDGDRSVWAFVELSNGLVWKSASWKAPALNYPRGCVHDSASMDRLAASPYGVTSLDAYHEALR